MVKVISHKAASQQQTNGFNRIRQVAPICPPMKAHWHHMPNTIELVPPWAHSSPQPKQQIDRFSRFCTAHDRKSLYSTMGAPFLRIAPIHGGPGPHLAHDSLGPYEPITQTASRSVSVASAGLNSVTDRPTDDAIRSVAIGYIYVRSTAMRPKRCQYAVSARTVRKKNTGKVADTVANDIAALLRYQ